MIDINKVYLTVQAILNKEQRGYVAPVEFNKFARQAQDEIFEAYFYDLAHFKLSLKGMSAANPADIQQNIKEKIDIFSEIGDCTFDSGRFTLPDSYRLGSVYYTGGDTMKQVEEIDKSMLQYILSSKLTAPSTTFPKYIRLDNKLMIYPDTIVDDINVHYIKKPSDPIWGHTSLGAKRIAKYNPDTSTQFEIHPSDRYLLVEKILQYAGVQIRQVDIVQFAAQDEAGDNQNKKQ